jgi:hypothetical protein
MKVEFQCRFKKLVLSEEKKAELEAQRIINGEESIPDTFDLDDEAYTYVGLVLDLKDIRAFNAVDKYHTCIRTYQLDSFIIKVPYGAFVDFYQNCTTELIKKIEVKYE